MWGRKPHPARFSRYLTTGAALSAFATLVGAFAINAQAAQLAALAQESALPTPTPSPTQTAAAVPAKKAVKKAVKKATAAKKPAKKSAAKKTATGGSTSTSSGSGTTPNPAVTYTCKSPGGTTKPLKNGSCSYIASYGYVKVQV